MKQVGAFINKNKGIVLSIIICLMTIILLKDTVLSNMNYNQTFKAKDLYYSLNEDDTNESSYSSKDRSDKKDKKDKKVKEKINESSKYSGKFSYGPYINLKKGQYIVTVNYVATDDNKVKVAGGRDEFEITSAVLPGDKKSVSIPLNMTYDEKEEGLEVITEFNGNGSFELKSIQIKKAGNLNEYAVIGAYILLIAISVFKFRKRSVLQIAAASAYISIMYSLLASIFVQNLVFLIIISAASILTVIIIDKKDYIEDKNFMIYSILSLLAFVIMFFCTKSSPFYSLNDWVDSQCYFTMGKGLFNGKVMYKDLFEQKGPVLFIIYGIGYLICNTDFYGIYLFEAIFFSITLIFSFKLANLFLSKRYAFIAAILFPFFMLNKGYFKFGGSCEEFIIVFKMVSLYFFIKYFKEENDEHNPKIMFLHGFLGACVLLMKFNATVFWAGFGACAFLRMLYTKKYKSFFSNVLYLIAGVLTVVVPVLIYFMIVNGMKEFIEAYVTFNFKYAATEAPQGKLNLLMNNIVDGAVKHIKCYGMLSFGVLWFVFKKKFINNFGKAGLLISFVLLHIGIYLGATYPYYFIIIADFSILGIIAILYIIEKSLKINIDNIAIMLSIVLVSILTIHFNGNYTVSKMFTTSITAQEEFACIMHEKSAEPTVLNYSFLDGGFYTKADVVPNVLFFHKLNIDYDSYPDNFEIQRNAIKNKEIEFIVYRGEIDSQPNIKEINKNYKLIATHDQKFEGRNNRYYLYQLKDKIS